MNNEKRSLPPFGEGLSARVRSLTEAKSLRTFSDEYHLVSESLDEYKDVKDFVTTLTEHGMRTGVIHDHEVSVPTAILGVFTFALMGEIHLQQMRVAQKKIATTNEDDAFIGSIHAHAALAEEVMREESPLGTEGSIFPLQRIANVPVGSKQEIEILNTIFHDIQRSPNADPYLSYLTQTPPEAVPMYANEYPELRNAKLVLKDVLIRVQDYLQKYLDCWIDIQSGKPTNEEFDHSLLPSVSALMGISIAGHFFMNSSLVPWTVSEYLDEWSKGRDVFGIPQKYEEYYMDQYDHAFRLKTDSGEIPYAVAQQTAKAKNADKLVTHLLVGDTQQPQKENPFQDPKVFRKLTKTLQAKGLNEHPILTIKSSDEKIDYIALSCMNDTLLDIIIKGKDGNAVLVQYDKAGRVIGGFPSAFNSHGSTTRAEALFSHIVPDLVKGLGLQIKQDEITTPEPTELPEEEQPQEPAVSGTFRREQRLAAYAAEKNTIPPEEASDEKPLFPIHGIEGLSEQEQIEIRQWLAHQNLVELVTSEIPISSYAFSSGKTILFDLDYTAEGEDVTSITLNNLKVS